MKFCPTAVSTVGRWLCPALLALQILTLAGCSDLAGEKPKIESADKKETPVASPVAGENPTSQANPPSSSGWENVSPNGVATSETIAQDSGASATLAADSGAAPANDTGQEARPEVSLEEAPMLYLRRGAQAKVTWRPWGGAAFKDAVALNRPILMVIGASWNHNSRALDAGTFAQDAVAKAINDDFIAVRVDADERPDVAARYRLAYEVINKKAASWPLVIFAMADGRPFDVVGYDALGAGGQEPALLPLLAQSLTLLKNQRADVEKQCASVEEVLKTVMSEPKSPGADSLAGAVSEYTKVIAPVTKGDSSEVLRGGLVAEALLTVAAGGGGSANQDAGSELMLTRFRSAQRDHVLGGYFYRVPEAATVEFGKLLTVQADYLAANSAAYGLTGKTLHKEAGAEVLRFCRDWLEAPEGGFFTAHTPDFSDDDNGGYFTWSKEEIASNAGEGNDGKVFAAYLNAKAGTKQALYVSGKLQQAADAVDVSYEEANKALATVRTKLTEARMAAEQIPSVDKAVLANWNGQAISAYLDSATYLNDAKAREFALKSADRIIGSMISEKDGVGHVLYKDKVLGYGLLDDNVKMAAALADCYRATSEKEYLDSAVSLMSFVEASFLDADTGLYFDRIAGLDEMGLLKIRRYPLDDDVTRCSNAVAAITWLKLAAAAGNNDYKARAERLINAAVERRTFNGQSASSWVEAASILKNGVPQFKK